MTSTIPTSRPWARPVLILLALSLTLALAVWLTACAGAETASGPAVAPETQEAYEAQGAHETHGAEEAAAAPAAPVAHPQRIAVTIDDLPAVTVVEPGTAGQRAVLEPIRRTLSDLGVPAVGFVNQDKMLTPGGDLDPERVALLGDWLDAGLELGNHSHSHPSLHRVPADEWLADVARGEEVLRRLHAGRGGELRWFRHPFLHTGRDVETRRRVAAELASRGVEVAPVTIDNEDYVFAAAWRNAHRVGDAALARRVEAAYVPYMLAKVAYYEAQVEGLFGRAIPHVLLLHANPLNAKMFGELARSLEERGYRFIPLAEALADPAYDSEDAYTGPAGISWVHRWAITRGVEPAFFRGEPETPGWVAELAAGGEG